MQSYKVFPIPLKMRLKGAFDWGGLYRLVWNWMLKREFRVHETRYKDKIDTALGNELEVNVWGEKEVTEYIMYKIKVDYHLWESKEVPMIVNGKQTKMMQGRIEIRINGEVITDWQKRYKDDVMTHKLMQTFMNKMLFKNEIDMKHVDPFDKDLHVLEGEIKRFLRIEASPTSVG